MAEQVKNWYTIDSIASIDSPSLVIYRDRVRKNIAAAIQLLGDVSRLRPHVKTHKSDEATRLMLAAGITKFKCATIAEADMLGACGAPDVLLAYQPAGPKIDRLLALTELYPKTHFSCLVDNAKAATALNEKFAAAEKSISVFMDLNVGMNRTGVEPGNNALLLFDTVTNLPALKLAGLHAYDGHITDPDLVLRTQKADKAYALVEQVNGAFLQRGFQNGSIVMGGSPTFPIHAARQKPECSPGTFVYWDAGYAQAFPEQPFLPAALVLSRVISQPEPGLFCTDLGHKSIAAENPLPRRVVFLNADGLAYVGQSEEHLVIKPSNAGALSIGDVLYGMPVHVCPTCALYERAVVVENGDVVGEWRMVARDRKINC